MYQVNDIGNVTWTGQASPDAPAAERRPASEQRRTVRRPAPRPARRVTLGEVQAQTAKLVEGFTKQLSKATTRTERETAQAGLVNAKRLQAEASALGPQGAEAEVARLMALYPPDTTDTDETPARDASADAEVERLMKSYGGPGGGE